MLRGIVLSMAALLSAGCSYGAYFLREAREPMAALEMRMDPGRPRRCLVVFMPGMFDTPDTFLEQGFLRDAARASDQCDLVAVDAHFGYYARATLRQRVTEDILRVAEGRGYREVWLVGVSMGGLGALLVARDNPELVRGVVLLAPFLGDTAVVRSVSEAGGLEHWEPPPIDDPYAEDQYTAALWAWLSAYVEEPATRPELYVGVGTEDRLRPGAELLGEVVPEGHFETQPGGHGWSTWRPLWRRLLESPPWAGPAERRGWPER